MLNKDRTLTHCILVAATAMSLVGCSEKTTTATKVNPDGSQTTTVTEQKGLNTKTTVTETPADSEDSVDSTDANHSKTKINFSIGKDTKDGADEVHVHGAGINIDTADGDGKVDIKLPFVKVKKDGNGRVQVKTPFANVEAHED
ncbi:MAG: hypothetical protein HYX67_04470 [Candidatus Melainabacteria bacterium]|nr:hypothetical protein [Candidatus Melainabacteria bacterium]